METDVEDTFISQTTEWQIQGAIAHLDASPLAGVRARDRAVHVLHKVALLDRAVPEQAHGGCFQLQAPAVEHIVYSKTLQSLLKLGKRMICRAARHAAACQLILGT